MLKLKRGKKSEEKQREYKKGRKKGAKKEGKKATVNDPIARYVASAVRMLSVGVAWRLCKKRTLRRRGWSRGASESGGRFKSEQDGLRG
jgi:hypothetical protein